MKIDLKPQVKNANKHTPYGLRLLEQSVQKDGFIDAQTAAADGEIISGSARLEMAAEKFADVEPIIVHSDGTRPIVVIRDDIPNAESARARRLSVAANKIAQVDFNPDFELLKEWAGEDEQIKKLFSDDEWREGTGEGKPQADAEAQIDGGKAIERWGVKQGDLFTLGNHKLLCGDSTNKSDIQRLTNGTAYCVLTDPPYNIGFEYNGMNDEMSKEKYAEFCRAWFDAVSDAVCVIFSPGPKNTRLYPEPRDYGFWLKRNASAGASAFNLRTIEPLLIYGKIGKKRNFDLFDYSSGFPEELRAAQRAALVEDKHPPAKPINLWLDIIDMLPDFPIVDCFSGNGTSFIAAEQKGKMCYGNERDPSYCALILERMITAFPNIEIKKLE